MNKIILFYCHSIDRFVMRMNAMNEKFYALSNFHCAIVDFIFCKIDIIYTVTTRVNQNH